MFVLAFTSYDVLRTTVAPGAGGGPLARRLAARIWHVAKVLSSGPRGRVLSIAGTLIMLVTIAAWVVLLWLGWTLIFAVDPAAVVRSASRMPATVSELIYFTGFALFSLGVGDVVPTSAIWQLLTPVVTLHGLFVITLSITYLLPVMNAVTERRQQAAAIWGMGGNAVQIVRQAWHDRSFASIEQDLQALAPALLMTVERHPTYPVLHYFHSDDPRTAFAPRVVALDDAVTLLLHVVDPQVRPHPGVLFAARRAVDDLLDVSSDADRDEHGGAAPPVPDLQALEDAGIPMVTQEEILDVFLRQEKRRRHLHRFVQERGWAWSGVAAQAQPPQ